jgi:hypothetical protein
MDVYHQCGSDFAINSTGGLALVAGPGEGQQRVLRRLLTNLGAYLWHLDYGAGLPAMIGKPAVQQRIQAVIISQMRLEQAVSQSPPPTVSVDVETTGLVTATIKYVDANSKLTSLIVIPLG